VAPTVAYATADWHYPEVKGGGAWKSLSGVGGDVPFALSQAVSLCVRDGADLWAAGDLLDGPDPEPDALAELFDVLRPMTATGKKIYYVLGNHDGGRDWLAALGPTAVNVSERLVQTPAGYTITGLDYVDKELFAVRAGSLAKTDVGLYHQTWREWTNGGGRSTLGDVPRHRLAVCGDVHVRGTVAPPVGPKLALSPGPLAPQSVAEFANKPVVWAVDADMAPKEVSILGRQYELYEVASGEDADKVLMCASGWVPDATLPPHVGKPLFAVRMTNPVPGFADTLQKMAAERGFVARVYAPTTKTDRSEAKTTEPLRTGLVGVILNWDAAPAARDLAAAVVAKGCKPGDVVLLAKDAHERKAGPKDAPSEDRAV
jgi:hypothetical protein